jgi:hypothetical protein
VEQLDAKHALLKYPYRNVLMSWPYYNKSWAESILRIINNQYFINIGESKTGCCVNDEFFNILDSEFVEVETVIIPQFIGIYDELFVFKRK